MKIVFIGPLPPPISSGQTQANLALLRHFQRGHEVKVIDTTTVRHITDHGETGRLSIRRLIPSFRAILIGLPRIFFSNRLDVTYITPAQSFLGLLKYMPFMWTARVRGIPCYIHIHGGYFRTMYNGLTGWKKRVIDRSLKRVAGAIVLGPSLRYMFEGLVPNEKIFVCENGVEDEIFATEEEIKQKIERYKNDDTIRIVYLSNLLESKGILDLFEAIKVVRRQRDKVHLDIAGVVQVAM